MDLAALLAYRVPEIRQAYRPRDAVLYALSVGAGRWAESARGRDILMQERGPAVLPSYLVDLGHPGFWLGDPATTVDAKRLLHAEECFTLEAPLPPEAEIVGRTRIVDVVDKGADKGALVYIEKIVSDALTGAVLGRVERTVMLRGDGGYGGPSGTPRPTPAFPDGAPDLVETMTVRDDQAFLYRLNGDPNPLHVEPEAARAAGFDRPIMHGLCTFGMAATAALFALADGDVRRMRGFRARFSAPVWPGETLRIEIWRCGALRAVSEERGVAVLTHGQADIEAS
jgi:acyl dehydratase